MTTSYSLSSTLYVNIGDLENGKTTSDVKVRVIRCYKQPSSHKSDPDGTLEMIVHDERGSHTYATMDYGIFNEKKIEIIEGDLYKIRTFIVAHDMTKYKSTTNPHKLWLYRLTSMAVSVLLRIIISHQPCTGSGIYLKLLMTSMLTTFSC
ncbi:hypothetical protein CASFOL_017498 [Castilleja foliolosa]|uniref:Replication protein A 70 kDa DNA-binding subunit B/D first OB fold domain-containing protein n=1 Tax=Castilleja foliolosa TaxID=1961234 RepID=A0ABD3DB87_9LAMI